MPTIFVSWEATDPICPLRRPSTAVCGTGSRMSYRNAFLDRAAAEARPARPGCGVVAFLE